jgi:hypothetical protein
MTMKTFADYLTESKKTYNFKVGIAGELPEGCVDQMETALQKYGIQNMSSGKKTPITERPLDFPQLQNKEVHYYEMELQYPTTVQVLAEYISQSCGIDTSHLIVRNLDAPQETYQDTQYDKVYEPKLATEDMGGESAQDDVGVNRTMGLLAELEKARKERENDPGIATEANKEQKQMAMDEQESSVSPVGSK